MTNNTALIPLLISPNYFNKAILCILLDNNMKTSLFIVLMLTFASIGLLIAITRFTYIISLDLLFSLYFFLGRYKELPTYIKTKTDMLYQLYFKYVKLPKLRRKTREGDTSSLTERITRSNHTRKLHEL